jgi:predicted O-methyltransferase YrrM
MEFTELMERMRAFQESRVLLTAVELDLFTAVGDGASAPQVASKIGTDLRATEMLMNALTALGAVTKHNGVFHNTPAVKKHLVGGSADNARNALMHTVHLWERWSTLTDCVRAGTAVTYKEVGDREEEWITAFIAAMHRNATGRAPYVLEAIGAEKVKRMLDVGGGSGAYSIAFAKARKDLKAEVLDLPRVLSIAQGHIEREGLSDRVKTRAGDLRKDKLGKDYDLVFVSAICHMLSPDENRDLFARSLEALLPGGRIVVQDFILETDKTAPRAAALFALNMLVGTRSGSSYSEDEYRQWLKDAGFEDIQRVRLPEPTGLMVAAKK